MWLNVQWFLSTICIMYSDAFALLKPCFTLGPKSCYLLSICLQVSQNSWCMSCFEKPFPDFICFISLLVHHWSFSCLILILVSMLGCLTLASFKYVMKFAPRKSSVLYEKNMLSTFLGAFSFLLCLSHFPSKYTFWNIF